MPPADLLTRVLATSLDDLGRAWIGGAPGRTPSSMAASLSQRCRQDWEIPKSFAIRDSEAPLRATSTTSRR
jgi:hypothetical protein